MRSVLLMHNLPYSSLSCNIFIHICLVMSARDFTLKADAAFPTVLQTPVFNEYILCCTDGRGRSISACPDQA